VQDRFQECLGCYLCVEVCALLTDDEAIRRYEVAVGEHLLGGVTLTDRKPDEAIPALPYEEYFSEGRAPSRRSLGQGARLREKMTAEERAILEQASRRSYARSVVRSI
jgi:hypothetical protein